MTQPRLMGILNVTPDSFSDGGQFAEPSAAVDRAVAMVEQGADFLDIGAESSRPGASPISEDEELSRLLPVVRAVCPRVRVPVSIDTTKAAVAEQALDLGASIINDITALRGDPGMAAVVARAGASLVLMHMHGTPATMQVDPHYDDVVQEVAGVLRARLRVAIEAGIPAERIVLDPGIGFGKNLNHNLTLLANLNAFRELGRPVLIGVSRKGFIGTLVSRPVGDRVIGTAAAVAVAVVNGARIIRVHDVSEMRDVVTVVGAILAREALNDGKPAGGEANH